MVSLMSNGGFRIYLSQNEILNPNHCLRYDPSYYYSPNFNQIEAQQNLIYPQEQQQQTTTEKEQKKAKKPKKKPGNEKIGRESLSLLDCNKDDLIAWLKQLPLEERFEVFSIKNAWLAIAFVKMYERWSESHDTVFALLLEENNKLSCEKNGLEFGDLDKHFYCRKESREKPVHLNQAEKEVIDSIRIYDDEGLYEMIGISEDLLQDIDKVIKLFETISGDSAFMKPCSVKTDHNSKTVVVDMPIWFNTNSFQTLAGWVVSNFEKAIWMRYLQNKRNPAKSSNTFGVFDFKLTLNYKRNLMEFWECLDRSKKKKLVSVVNDTLQYLNSDQSKAKASDNGKEINQALKAFYENSLFARARATFSAEGLSAYFSHLFEEENEKTVVETILMTSLSQFGLLQNLLCRKLAHKLKNMLSEKIASDLILTEEREKKSCGKKRHPKKKKAKKPNQKNDASDLNNSEDKQIEIVIPDDTGAINVSSNQEVKNNKKKTDNVEETKNEMDPEIIQSMWGTNVLTPYLLTGSEMPDTFVVQIKDLESQQTLSMLTARKSEEKFINHFTEASTTNVSDSDDKQEIELKPIVSKQIEKDQKSQSTVVKSEGQAQGNQVEEKNSAKTGKENKGLAIADEWEIFDESDKKTIKSQKKKQKRKSKKKTEQEQEPEKKQEQKEEEETKIDEENNLRSPKAAEPASVKERKQSERSAGTIRNQKEEKAKQDNLTEKEQTLNEKESLASSSITSRKNSGMSSNYKNDKLRLKTDKNSIHKEDEYSQSAMSSNRRSSGNFGKDFWKEDVSVKSIATSTTTPDVDDAGFIEVKAKKKPEKEVKQKGKKESKEFWRKKKEKEVIEKKKPPVREIPKAKSPQEEVKKAQGESHLEKPSRPMQNAAVSFEHSVHRETLQKNNSVPGKPDSITGPGPKILAPKPLKKSVSAMQPPSGSSNSSEAETAGSDSKTTSTASQSSHHSNSRNHVSHTPDNMEHGHRSHKGHPLKISSPSLDPETIKIAKAKEFANEYFNKKFASDVFEHVAGLTDEANKMTQYRILAYKRLDYCIASIFPNTNVKTKIFGSCATGLALKTSDVDIAVSGLGTYERFALCDYLLLISNTLGQFKWVTINQPILTASVPILKLEIDLQIKFSQTHEQPARKFWTIATENKEDLDPKEQADKEILKIRVDLSFESMGIPGYNFHVGYITTDFVQKMLEKYESLYIVTMVIKEFLHNRKLLDVYKGGIGSYCLVVMIVALFQKFGDEGYMASLRRFFSFYGEVFKPESTGITLLERDPFFPLSHSYETAPLWVIVEHCNFERKNIGQGAYSIKVILHEFDKVFKTIEYVRQKIEESAVKHFKIINSVDDIGKIELEPDTQKLVSSNILDLFIMDV